MTNTKKYLTFNYKIISLLVLCGGIIFLLGGCNKNSVKSENQSISTDFIMDTFIEYKLYGENSKEATKEMSQRLREFEDNFSAHKENSYIGQINKNSGICETVVPDEVYSVIDMALENSKLMRGNFDLTVAPLTFLWNVTGENPTVPPQGEIDTAKALVNYEDVVMNNEEKSIMLRNKGQGIDLGGMAKGEATKIIFEVAKKYQISCGYVSIGGNLAVIGKDIDGKDYRFGIRDPLGSANEYIGTVNITGKTMATTGEYERFFEKDGKKYSHIINPKTGYPAKSEFLSVTIIGSGDKDGGFVDMLSTAMFVGGKECLDDFIGRDDIGVVAIGTDNKIYLSKALKENFKINEKNGRYTLA
ncbi:MAG: FAD:protein FMN transferase [Oscillospiraceae bacterium]